MNIKCRSILSIARFIFEQKGEQPTEEALSSLSEARVSSTDLSKLRDQGNTYASAGAKMCDEFSCKVEVKKPSWKEKVDVTLNKIVSNPDLTSALDTCLKAYAVDLNNADFFAQKGITKETLLNGLTGDTMNDFYNTMSEIGYPSSEGGFQTFCRDIIGSAERTKYSTHNGSSFFELKKLLGI